MRADAVYVGYDQREAAAFAVACSSIANYNCHIPVYGLVLDQLREAGLYKRPTKQLGNKLIDELSVRDDFDGSISTEFAISRFLTPHLHGDSGLALFMDCDMLVRDNLSKLFQYCASQRSEYAVWCVKHDYAPSETTKMDGQMQTRYARKNWSSVMVFNCAHPSNKRLTIDLINSAPGRDLHAFCWLEDHEIGELDPRWNVLVGHTKGVTLPGILHYTSGGPWFRGFEDVPYADDWNKAHQMWASRSLEIPAR